MPRTRRWLIGFSSVVVMLAFSLRAHAVPGCPFCAPSDPPFSQRLANCDVALLVKWVSLTSDEKVVGKETTVFEVISTFRSTTTKRKFQPKELINWGFGRDGNAGDPFLLIGMEDGDSIIWEKPLALTGEYLYAYIRVLPPPEDPNRLAFFLKFLEFPDSEICNDAYAEFSRAQFKEVAALAPKLPRAKLRTWLESSDPQIQVRLGLYGMMLGLGGDDSDAEFLERQILKAPDPNKPRFGIDGMMAGYVLLTGEVGLHKLLDAKFNDPLADDDLLAMRNSLMFLWEYAQDRVSPDLLRASMRRFLGRPKVAVNVIENLARWKDWESLDLLIAAYGKAPFDSIFTRQKVIAFALACERDGIKTSPDALPQTALTARRFLNGLDRDLVKGVERTLLNSKSAVEANSTPQE
jgi:hypothetical protein